MPIFQSYSNTGPSHKTFGNYCGKTFYRIDALSVTQPTVSEHQRTVKPNNLVTQIRSLVYIIILFTEPLAVYSMVL